MKPRFRLPILAKTDASLELPPLGQKISPD